MQTIILDTYEDLSRRAASIILRQLEEKRDMLLCAATGNSPDRTYALLSEEYGRRPGLFSDMRVLKLDEWGGLPLTNPGTCESYLRTHVLEPLNIAPDRYISFESDPADPEEECRRMRGRLSEAGPIDCCILGIGVNGHIALNEPASWLQPNFHVAQLAPTTLNHTMVTAAGKSPTYGLTMGVGDILQSKMIVLLISGATKKEITGKLLSQRGVTPELPASFLLLHPNTVCIIDRQAAPDQAGNQ